jgi:hypothetical protein
MGGFAFGFGCWLGIDMERRAWDAKAEIEVDKRMREQTAKLVDAWTERVRVVEQQRDAAISQAGALNEQLVLAKHRGDAFEAMLVREQKKNYPLTP